jgi:hypothetical protein
LRSGSDSDISEALSDFSDALAGALDADLHRHAMQEARKGMFYHISCSVNHFATGIILTILFQQPKNAF